MNILLLPGVNPATVEWLDLVVQNLELQADNLLSVKYSFWADSSQRPDLASVVSSLPEESFDLVIAKSFGTMVFLQARLEDRISCHRAILFGIPINSASKVPAFQADKALNQLIDPSFLLIQQNEDKFGHAELLKEFQPPNLLTIPGNDHQYDQFEHYIEESKTWLFNP